jgi:DmsE family decaheme c-type cytochrome
VRGGGPPVGAEACLDCHDSFDGHWVSSEYHADCERCHGAGERHAFTARPIDVRYPSSADCMACHEGGHETLIGWRTSPHARAEVLCSDCHDTHARELHALREAPAGPRATLPQASESTKLCASCHPGVAASLNLPSHHPVREGMMDCTDCHSPHADRAWALGAETRRCTVCHEGQAGPWIFEHTPVAEDCGECHEPHGASALNLLAVTQPGVCISCHTIAEAGAVHDPYAYATRCTDCHSAIHGSYADPHLMR